MSEERLNGDDLRPTDAEHRIVSRNLDTFSDENVQRFVNKNKPSNVNPPRIPIHATFNIKSLNNALSYMERDKCNMSDVEKLTDDFALLVNNGVVPTALLTTVAQKNKPLRGIHDTLVSCGVLVPPSPRKRKRDSPEEASMRIRLELQKYAYKSTITGNKNVSFKLQKTPTASQSESSMVSETSSTDVTIEESNQRPSTSHTIAPLRIPPPVITPEDARDYQVPGNKTHIWKLLEAQLRKVGRHDAHVSQLTESLAVGRPPSWCFGGSIAPLHMRPFHDILVNITQAYANTMAAAARQIIFQQAQEDQREATSLLETLRRLYVEDEDPDFELAHQRALGIATHYKDKEVQLNKRQQQADTPNQPQTRAEWADCLARRKVSKPSRGRTSRSRSPAAGRRNAPNNRGQNQGQRQNPQPPRPTNNNPQRQKTQPGQQHTRAPRDNRNQPRQQQNSNNAPRNNNSGRNQSTAAQASGSYTNQPNNARQPNQRQGNNNTPRPATLNLNSEEQALITMMRAAKNNNN